MKCIFIYIATLLYYYRNKRKAGTFISIGGMEWEAVNFGTNRSNPLGVLISQYAALDSVIEDICRVPTPREWKQLKECTHHKFIAFKWWRFWQPAGMLLTDKENGNTLFLPAAGLVEKTPNVKLRSVDDGCYWSSKILHKSGEGQYTYFNTKYKCIYCDATDSYHIGISVRCIKPLEI